MIQVLINCNIYTEKREICCANVYMMNLVISLLWQLMETENGNISLAKHNCGQELWGESKHESVDNFVMELSLFGYISCIINRLREKCKNKFHCTQWKPRLYDRWNLDYFSYDRPILANIVWTTCSFISSYALCSRGGSFHTTAMQTRLCYRLNST